MQAVLYAMLSMPLNRLERSGISRVFYIALTAVEELAQLERMLLYALETPANVQQHTVRQLLKQLPQVRLSSTLGISSKAKRRACKVKRFGNDVCAQLYPQKRGEGHFRSSFRPSRERE